MANEWLKVTRSKVRLADNLRAETSKSLATSEKKNKEFALKLVTADKDRKSAKTSLKNA